MIDLIRKYRSALVFVLKFVAFYIILNLIYGFYVEFFRPNPDPVTYVVSAQTSTLLNWLGNETYYFKSDSQPNVIIGTQQDGSILSVYEGCNGINVFIVFLSFLIAFRWNSKLFWFVPLGIFLIHLANLLRIGLLFFVSTKLPDYLYFTHKYLFTAFIFVIVFVLWYWWLRKGVISPK